MVVKLVGAHAKVVDVPGVITIEELVGGVSTKDDAISVASTKTGAGASEPWLTMQYDEWLCVVKGQCVAKLNKDDTTGETDVVINEGQTGFIEKGSTWKPTFPVETEYIAICRPAFRPDRCIREDESNAEGMVKLKEMHSSCKASGILPVPPPSDKDSDLLYHMTTEAAWMKVLQTGDAYYPPTFEEDGYYTHATAVPTRLITTANHFYQEIEGDWVILELTRSALKKCGLFVRDEKALPVGDKAVGDDWGDWICPHIIGGIPPVVVKKVLPMIREGKEFTGIDWLSDA